MKVSKMMEEVWRWKDEVAHETAKMSTKELIAYYKTAEQRLAGKTGKKLELPCDTRRGK